MRSRRAGCGGSSGIALPSAPRVPAPPPTAPIATLGDDPRIAAALRYARADVRAYEQTEAYWRGVWAEEAERAV